MYDVETVKIKHPDGYTVINKEDFNQDVHELYVEKVKEVEPTVKKKKK